MATQAFMSVMSTTATRYNKYIQMSLNTLLGALKSNRACHVVVMVDGGPRVDVVKEIFSLVETYKNLTVDIFLLEAYRDYYQPIITSRTGGRFIKAEKNERLDGMTYLKEPSNEERMSSCIK